MVEMAFELQPMLTSELLELRPPNLRSHRAVEKIGGVRIGMKTDPNGRENFIFRITRALSSQEERQRREI